MSETVSLSPQKGIVTADSITQGGHTAGAAYTYDTLGRLTQATVDNWQYQYAFGTQASGCTSIAGYNANANKDGNRTSTSITNTSTSTNTTNTSCYSAADRLASSTDTQIGTPTYDDHGSITQLAGAGTPIQLTYDASDQNTKIQQGTSWTEYTKSAGGTTLIRKEYVGSTLTKVYKNAGGVLLTCNLTTQTSCTTLDKYIGLPGGVGLTVKNGTPVYSVKNFHGDTAITVDTTGNPTTSVFLYDPFGQVLTSNTFGTSGASLNNASDNSMGWAASPTRKAESMFSIPIIEMGARVYLPTLGRFTSVDPVEGGTDNTYSYSNDPVNENDYSGKSLFGSILSAVAKVIVQAVKSVINAVIPAPVQTFIKIALSVAVTAVVLSYTKKSQSTTTAQRSTANAVFKQVTTPLPASRPQSAQPAAANKAPTTSTAIAAISDYGQRVAASPVFQGAVKGCGLGIVQTTALAVGSSVIGGPEIGALEIATGCAVGAIAGELNVMAPNGGMGVEQLDEFNTARNFYYFLNY